MIELPVTLRIAGWAILQSLWQGALLLMAFLAMQHLLRSTSAELRYRIALAFLGLLLALPIATGIAAWRSALDAAVARPAPMSADTDAADVAIAAVIACWAAGALIGLIRLRSGYAGLQTVVSRAVAASELEHRVALHCRSGGHRSAPRVCWSADAMAPLVSGWTDPVILLPRELPRQLDSAELDAILLHEVAHAQRHDFAVNLVQRVIEALLWFQPAAWLASAVARREREHCCDEAVVRATGRRAPLARALVRLEEQREVPVLAMPGGGGELHTRVERLVSGTRVVSRDRTVAAAAVAAGVLAVALVVISSAFAAASPVLAAAWPVVTLRAHDAAGTFVLELVGGRARRAMIDGVAVPSDRMQQLGKQLTLAGTGGLPDVAVRITQGGRGIIWTPRVRHP